MINKEEERCIAGKGKHMEEKETKEIGRRENPSW